MLDPSQPTPIPPPRRGCRRSLRPPRTPQGAGRGARDARSAFEDRERAVGIDPASRLLRRAGAAAEPAGVALNGSRRLGRRLETGTRSSSGRARRRARAACLLFVADVADPEVVEAMSLPGRPHRVASSRLRASDRLAAVSGSRLALSPRPRRARPAGRALRARRGRPVGASCSRARTASAARCTAAGVSSGRHLGITVYATSRAAARSS